MRGRGAAVAWRMGAARVTLLLGVTVALLASGCDGGAAASAGEEPAGGEAPEAGGGTAGDPGVADEGTELDLTLAEFDASQAQTYASRLAPVLVRRTLREEEVARLEAAGGEAIRELLEAWIAEPGFAEARAR